MRFVEGLSQRIAEEVATDGYAGGKRLLNELLIELRGLDGTGAAEDVGSAADPDRLSPSQVLVVRPKT